jgi:hypothetical protein
MRAMKLVLIAFALIYLAAGCSGDKKKQQKSPESRRLAADLHPKSNPLAGLTPSVVDTLRAKRRIYNVTRDEYWDDKGGVLGNEYFEVWYSPGRVTVTHGMFALEEAMFARRQFHRTFGAVPDEKLNVILPADMTNYLLRTGREWWYYSSVKEDTVIFQPVYVLVKRGLAPIAITHEYAQWAMERLSRQRAPRWFVEGLASLMSNEASVLIDQLWEFDRSSWRKTPSEIESILIKEEDRQSSRIAYYHAFKMMQTLEAQFGYGPLTQFIIRLGDNEDLDAVSRDVFNKSYQELIAMASNYEIDTKQ